MSKQAKRKQVEASKQAGRQAGLGVHASKQARKKASMEP